MLRLCYRDCVILADVWDLYEPNIVECVGVVSNTLIITVLLFTIVWAYETGIFHFLSINLLILKSRYKFTVFCGNWNLSPFVEINNHVNNLNISIFVYFKKFLFQSMVLLICNEYSHKLFFYYILCLLLHCYWRVWNIICFGTNRSIGILWSWLDSYMYLGEYIFLIWNKCYSKCISF